VRRSASSLTLGLTSRSSGRRLAFVSQVAVFIRLFLEINRWPRGLSSLVRASTGRYFFTVLTVDHNTAEHAMLL
jgi:hypothetical protein